MKYEKKLPALILLLFSFITVSCLTEGPLKVSFSTFTPPNLSDGWDISDPDAENINGELLKDIYKYAHEDDGIWQIRSLLVFRNNKLVAESYMKNAGDRTNPLAIWSCTKQFTAIAAGIAVDKGLISINDPISNCLPQVSSSQHADKSLITIENLLMMKSGINFNNDGFNGETSQLLREEPSNSLNFILGLGMRNTPGTSFYYNDGDPQIVSAVLQETTGKSLREWTKENLLDKIGITRLQWLSYKDGITMGAFGILTTPREMAKLGQLVMNGGLWNSTQIVSAGWIADMTLAKVSMDETQEDNITFGYYWWGDASRNIVFMRGHGGQYVFINKAKNLMVVITSEPNTQGDFQLLLNQGLSIYDRIDAISN